jgi:hypothetical protein
LASFVIPSGLELEDSADSEKDESMLACFSTGTFSLRFEELLLA